jgi:hypothetical protein
MRNIYNKQLEKQSQLWNRCLVEPLEKQGMKILFLACYYFDPFKSDS